MTMTCRRRRAMTLIEMTIASLFSALLGFATIQMFSTVSKQTRVNMSHEIVRRQANRMIDILIDHIRRSSVDNPVDFDSATEIEPGVYDSVRFWENGTQAEFRVENVVENGVTRRCILYDPNTLTPGDEQIIARDDEILPHTSTLEFIENQIGVNPDHTTLTIFLTVTDEAQTQESILRGGGAVEFTATGFVALRAPG